MVKLGKYSFIIFVFFSRFIVNAQNVPDTIETFENNITLHSFGEEDIEPLLWEYSTITYYGGERSLKLYGNTWKSEDIPPRQIDSNSVWQIAVFIEEPAEINGFGIGDGTNYLFYSFAGSEEVEFENWQTVYQGAFPTMQWKLLRLPIGCDWISAFGYLPEISDLVFVNDKDNSLNGITYYDEIVDVSNSLPKSPIVSINYSKQKTFNNGISKSVEVQFQSEVYDPDSDEWQYYWDFADGTTSADANPFHTFTVCDDHSFSVSLEVEDESGNYGTAFCKISVDEGESSFPLTINFVGDIMLARGMENIINYDGIESIFSPTLSYFGNNADISVANLECPLTNSWTHHPTKPIYFKGEPEYAAGLVYAGIDAVNIANNHIYDYLDSGLLETIETLNNYEIVNFGAGINSYFAKKPGYISKKGVSVAFIGASNRTGQYNNYQPYLNAGFDKAGFANLTEYNITEQINNAGKSDLIIFQMHSGHEYSTEPHKAITTKGGDEFYNPDYFSPSKSDIRIRRFAIDSGADAVICHHPHITQGFEVYKGKLIAHSLGNFIFDMGYPETFPSVILKGFADDNGFYKYEVLPIFIDNYIPHRVKGELGLFWLNTLADMSRKLNAFVYVNNDSASAEIILDTASIEFNTSRFEKEINFTLGDNGFYYSIPIKIEKKGSISKIISVGGNTDFEFSLGKEKFWGGNMENEGANFWEFNHSDEFFDNNEFAFGTRSLCQKRPTNRLPLNTYLLHRQKIYHPEKEFTLHSFIKTENGKNAGAQIIIYDSRYSDYNLGVYELNTEVSGTTPWREYFGDFEIPENGKYYNIRLRSESPQSGMGYSWFDNVGLIEWDNWRSCSEENIVEFPNDYYWIRIRKTNAENYETIVYEKTALYDNPDDVGDDESEKIPERFVLEQNYPNPFNPTTTIKYSIPSVIARSGATRLAESCGQSQDFNTTVRLSVYDVLGQEIATLVNKRQLPGSYRITFNANNLPSGIYFYTLRVGEFSETKKMVLLK